MAALFLVLLLGLAAGCLSGVIGTGSSVILLPVLIWQYGPKQAVPIMAVAAVIANVGRVAAWWKVIDWKAVAAYTIHGMPAAALGARTLLALPVSVVDAALGVFFFCMIGLRRLRAKRAFHIPWWGLSLAGAGVGFLTGVVLSTGPLSVPVFISYGLSGGAFLGTEAASSLALYISKVITFRQFGALPVTALLQGVIIGASLMLGAFAGKAVVLRMPPHRFDYLLDALMLCSGVALIWTAITAHS